MDWLQTLLASVNADSEAIADVSLTLYARRSAKDIVGDLSIFQFN